MSFFCIFEIFGVSVCIYHYKKTYALLHKDKEKDKTVALSEKNSICS